MRLFENLTVKHLYLLLIWLLINLVQSYFTDLHIDESYYWLYSRHLDWGYFDHPPMVALFIFIGDSVMHNELGVRIFSVLVSTLTMALILNELNEKKEVLFSGLFIVSFPLIHMYAGGFLALPDIPLTFFTLLFFLYYRKFAEKPNLKLSVVLAVLAAAMIYSKYHAFAVLGLIFLSNIRLIKNKYFWLIILSTSILLIPHIIWQIENHFPTFRYHLLDRRKSFQAGTFLSYVLSQIAIAGPLTGVLILYSLTKIKTKENPFNRAVLFSIAGLYLLFLVMSFNNRIEPHWTSVIMPVLILATYPVVSSNPALKKWFIRLAVPSIILIFLFRFYLAAGFIPNFGNIKSMYYNKLATANQVKELANGKKVASFNNFAFPAFYEFYTGDPVVHMATPGYRFCQFDLWNEEEGAEGDSLFIVLPEYLEPGNLIQLKNGKKVKTITIPKFQSLKKLEIQLNNGFLKNDTLFLNISLKNNFDHAMDFAAPSMPMLGFTQAKKDEISATPLNQLTKCELFASADQITFTYPIPLQKINRSQSLVLFTQTAERNRGDMLAINVEDFIKR